MDVLFLAHSYPRWSGDAAGSFLLRLAVALRDEDVHVRVVAPAAAGLPAFEELEGIPVHRYRYAPPSRETLAYGGNMAQLVRSSWAARLALVSFLGAGLRSARRLRRRYAPQVVHAHWWFPGGLVGSWLPRRPRTPMVTTIHGTDLRIARDTPVVRPAFRRVLGRSAAVTTVSRWLADEVVRLQPGANPVVAPMPAATDLFHPRGERDPGRLLFVGRLTGQKGVDHLLRALATDLPHATLDVIGGGPDEAPLHELAGALRLGERVRWLGALPQPELAEHYARAAAVVVPSHEEGLGLVAVEAMLSGAPVVASDSGGLRDVVEHGRTGILVPSNDAAGLGAALARLLAPDAADQRARLAEAGREHALATFAPRAVARDYAGIYREVVAGATAR